MSYRRLLAELADRIQQLAKAIGERANIPDVEAFERDRDWILKQIDRLPRPLTVWILDNRYRTTTLDGFRRIIEWDRTNLRPYIAEFWDCDDYAWRFKSNVTTTFLVNGIGFVIDWSKPECAHSYNVLFPTDSDPVVYEPQTDQIMSVGEARRHCQYKMDNYVIVV